MIKIFRINLYRKSSFHCLKESDKSSPKQLNLMFFNYFFMKYVYKKLTRKGNISYQNLVFRFYCFLHDNFDLKFYVMILFIKNYFNKIMLNNNNNIWMKVLHYL